VGWVTRAGHSARSRPPARPVPPDARTAKIPSVTHRSLRVAVVGLGYWGPNLARAFHSLQETELTWLCDLDEGLLDRVGRQFPEARRTTDLDVVLADDALDAVVIATSVPTHCPLAMRAIAAGKHVFVEKPLATSGAEARELARAAEAAGVVLFVGHLLVHHPAVAKLEELMSTDVLGETRYIYTTRVNLGKVRADENALWSLGVHDVAVLLHLLGETPQSVSAQGQAFIRPDVEDVVFCLLRFSAPVIAHMQLSWLDPHKMRRVTIVGSEKMAVFDDMRLEQKVTVYDKGVTFNGRAPMDFGEYVQLRSGDTFSPRISAEEPLRLEARQFARAALGLEQPRSGAAEGIAVVDVLEALQHSLDHDGVTVTPSATLLTG
jgi:predicted dehydrogenase